MSYIQNSSPFLVLENCTPLKSFWSPCDTLILYTSEIHAKRAIQNLYSVSLVPGKPVQTLCRPSMRLPFAAWQGFWIILGGLSALPATEESDPELFQSWAEVHLWESLWISCYNPAGISFALNIKGVLQMMSYRCHLSWGAMQFSSHLRNGLLITFAWDLFPLLWSTPSSSEVTPFFLVTWQTSPSAGSLP